MKTMRPVEQVLEQTLSDLEDEYPLMQLHLVQGIMGSYSVDGYGNRFDWGTEQPDSTIAKFKWALDEFLYRHLSRPYFESWTSSPFDWAFIANQLSRCFLWFLDHTSHVASLAKRIWYRVLFGRGQSSI